MMDERDFWNEPFIVDGKPCVVPAGGLFSDSAGKLLATLVFEDGSTMTLYRDELEVLERERQERINARFGNKNTPGT